jgi:hypothetical protein
MIPAAAAAAAVAAVGIDFLDHEPTKEEKMEVGGI